MQVIDKMYRVDWENPLEKGMATHNSILAMDQGDWCYSQGGCKESDMTE